LPVLVSSMLLPSPERLIKPSPMAKSTALLRKGSNLTIRERTAFESSSIVSSETRVSGDLMAQLSTCSLVRLVLAERQHSLIKSTISPIRQPGRRSPGTVPGLRRNTNGTLSSGILKSSTGISNHHWEVQWASEQPVRDRFVGQRLGREAMQFPDF